MAASYGAVWYVCVTRTGTAADALKRLRDPNILLIGASDFRVSVGPSAYRELQL